MTVFIFDPYKMMHSKDTSVIVKQDGTIQEQLTDNLVSVQRLSVGVYKINYEKMKLERMPSIQITSYSKDVRCALEGFPNTKTCTVHCLGQNKTEDWVVGFSEVNIDAAFAVDIRAKN